MAVGVIHYLQNHCFMLWTWKNVQGTDLLVYKQELCQFDRSAQEARRQVQWQENRYHKQEQLQEVHMMRLQVLHIAPAP